MSKKETTERINRQIKNVSEVRIVGDGIESRVLSFYDALKMAEDAEMDLIEIKADSNPPVCKIADYSKLLYEKKQREKLQRQNSKKFKIKEIRLTYNTGEHDFNFKLNHAINFLKDGDKVKALVFFSGRENNYIEQGNILLLKFVDALMEFGKPENLPRLEGKRLWVMLSPKK